MSRPWTSILKKFLLRRCPSDSHRQVCGDEDETSGRLCHGGRHGQSSPDPSAESKCPYFHRCYPRQQSLPPSSRMTRSRKPSAQGLVTASGFSERAYEPEASPPWKAPKTDDSMEMDPGQSASAEPAGATEPAVARTGPGGTGSLSVSLCAM